MDGKTTKSENAFPLDLGLQLTVLIFVCCIALFLIFGIEVGEAQYGPELSSSVQNLDMLASAIVTYKRIHGHYPRSKNYDHSSEHPCSW